MTNKVIFQKNYNEIDKKYDIICIKTSGKYFRFNSVIYHYNQKDTFTEAVRFVDFLAERLKGSANELLQSAGFTYDKWRVEIANGLAKNQNNIRYTNGIAESINNHLKTIIKTSYGFHNFDRFRKKAMLVITYKTPK